MNEEKSALTVRISLTSFFWAIGLVGALYFLYQIQPIVIALFFSLIVMSALRPSVTWMERKLRFPRILAIMVMYIIFVLLLAVAITLIIPPLVRDLPVFIQTLSLPPLPSDLLDIKTSLTELSSFLPQIGTSFTTVFNVISSTFNGVFAVLTILVMASYLLLDRENLHLKVSWFTKERRHLTLAKELIDQVELQLGGWVRGQLSLMVIIGLTTYVGLSLLGIPYALPLALTAGLLEVLPNLGPTLASVPAIAIGFIVGGPWLAVFTAIFYILVQQLENNLIVPKVMKDNVDVNPLTTILLILIGLRLGGVVGALLSVPVYIVVRSVYSMWYREFYTKPSSR